MSGIVSLELQIISINVIGLFGSIWNWFKWDQQLEKISNFSVSNELDVKDIDWLKTVLSWIEVIRSVIDRTLFPAYIANIYTIVTRRWQNSLIFWMVLSLLKDIVLEVVVVVITFLQWNKGSVSTLLFIEFITEKMIWLGISTGKWWTILKWYTQLRKEAKIRRFARITQRSITSIPGRVGHSLDDECLDIAASRRDKYASLLNLSKLSEKSCKINFDNLRTSKSLTMIINNDSHDSNDTNDLSIINSSINDLSVTEKSMKLLGITAEDVMDACARIQERFYWNEEDIGKTGKTSEEKEKIVAQFSLEKDGEEMDNVSGNEQKDNVGKTADRILEKKDVMIDSQIEKDERKDGKEINDALRSKQTTKDAEKAVDCNLMIEVIMQNFLIEREGEEDNNKIISVDKTADRTLEKKDVVRDSQIEKDEREDGKEINDALRSKQTTKDAEKAVDCNLMKEVIMQNFQIEREGEEDNNKIISVDKTADRTLEKKDVVRDSQIEKDEREDGKEINDALRSKQTTKDAEKAVDCNLMIEVSMQNFLIEREEEEDNNKIISVDKTADRTLEKKDVVRDSQIEKDEREDGKEINDALRNKQTTKDAEKAVDYNLIKEVIMQNFQIEREGEEDNNKIISVDKKEQILTDKKQDVSLIASTKDGDVTSNRTNNPAESNESHKLQEEASSRKNKGGEKAEKLARIMHCPLSSAECKHARNVEAKPCASFVRKLEAKLRPISTNQKERWLDQLDQKKYSYRGKLTPTDSDANKKDCLHNNSRTSLCACHRASKRNIDASKNGKYARSIDINDKNVKHDIDRKEFRHFVSILNKQKDKINGRDSTFKYSEAYRLKKQMQKFEGTFRTRQTIAWGSMSLGQTARPSGYTRDAVTTNRDKPPGINRRDVQTEARDESSDSLNARNRSERRVEQSRQSIDPRIIYNTSLTEKNYARSQKREAKTSEAHNDLTLLTNKKGTKARRRHDLSPSRKLSNEKREAVELRALRAFNELTLLEDKKKLEEKKNRESSLNYEQLTGESEVTEMNIYTSYNDLTLLEEQEEMDATRGQNSSCKQLIEESSALKVCDEYISSEDKGELKVEEKHDSKYEMPEKYEESVDTSTSVFNHLSEVNREETGIPSFESQGTANSSSELHEGQACVSLNLREITRNIEWTLHPRGVILTNKNLHRQFIENARSRESQQRDIVDDNIASTLHSAFFFKPEVVTRIFRRAQTRIGESLPSFPTFGREDLNTEFVCRMNNETVIQWDRDSSSLDFDLERITADRGNLRSSSFPNASGNRVAGEDNRDLCIIFIDQEQASHESDTTIIEDSVGSQEDTRSSAENIETMNILLVCVLRDFGIEMSEENVHDITSSAERIEEYGDISNVIANNTDFPLSNFTANDTSPEEEGNDKREGIIPLHQQILHTNSNDSQPDDVDVTSSVNSLHDNPDNLSDKKYISAIDVSSEKTIYEDNSLRRTNNSPASQLSNSSNNNSFDMIVNQSEKSIFNRISENASQLSSSFIKEEFNLINQSMLRLSDEEELQSLTQLSDSEVTLENHRRESVMNLETTNDDAISRSENVETSDLLETMVRDGIRNEEEDADVYVKANIFSIHRFFRMNQEDDELQQDDSFYSLYEKKDDGAKTPVSIGDGSLMEEFSNSTVSETSSNASTRSSAHFQ